MSHGSHAIVWIDHQVAKVYRFGADGESEKVVNSHMSLQRLHHRPGGWEAGGNLPDDSEFFHRIMGTLEHADRVVVTGPGNAKSALKAFIDHLRPGLASHTVSVESPEVNEVPEVPDAAALVALGRATLLRSSTQPGA